MHNLFNCEGNAKKTVANPICRYLGSPLFSSESDASFRKNRQPVLGHADHLHRFFVEIIQDFLFQQVACFACFMDGTVLQQHQFLEARQDFLGVVADVDHCRPFRLIGDPLDILQKFLFCEQVQAVAGLVQNQNFRIGHQSAGDQNDLLLPLGQDAVAKANQFFAAAFDQKIQRLLFFGFSGDGPDADRSELPAQYDVLGDVVGVQLLLQGRADPAYPFAQVGDGGLPESFAQHDQSAAAGPQIAVQELQQGCLAGAVQAEYGPMLAFFCVPIDVVQNFPVIANDIHVVESDHSITPSKVLWFLGIFIANIPHLPRAEKAFAIAHHTQKKMRKASHHTAMSSIL